MSFNHIITCVLGMALLMTLKNNKDQLIEHFGMLPSRKVRVETVGVDGTPANNMFTVPPSYQATLNPRQAGNAPLGAFIRYNLPDKKYRADSMGSLISEKPIITEGFDTDTDVPSLPSYSASGLVPLQSQASDEDCGTTTNELGELVAQPCVYQNYIYANAKSGNLADRDRIRGDLPITPENRGWFSVSANPDVDLTTGAMFVMGGIDNDTTKELLALKSMYSGLNQGVGSGVKYNISRAQSLGAGKSDIKVTPVGFY